MVDERYKKIKEYSMVWLFYLEKTPIGNLVEARRIVSKEYIDNKGDIDKVREYVETINRQLKDFLLIP